MPDVIVYVSCLWFWDAHCIYPASLEADHGQYACRDVKMANILLSGTEAVLCDHAGVCICTHKGPIAFTVITEEMFPPESLLSEEASLQYDMWCLG